MKRNNMTRVESLGGSSRAPGVLRGPARPANVWAWRTAAALAMISPLVLFAGCGTISTVAANGMAATDTSAGIEPTSDWGSSFASRASTKAANAATMADTSAGIEPTSEWGSIFASRASAPSARALSANTTADGYVPTALRF